MKHGDHCRGRMPEPAGEMREAGDTKVSKGAAFSHAKGLTSRDPSEHGDQETGEDRATG